MSFGNPIYLHFLDRELTQSIGVTLRPETAQAAVRAMLLSSEAPLYAGISIIWESPSLQGQCGDTEGMLLDLITAGSLEIISQHSTTDEFLASRQTLYAHDAQRYPMYFGSVERRPLAKLNPQHVKRTSATRALDKALTEWTQSDHGAMTAELEAMAKKHTRASLSRRDEKAVTYSLFQDIAETGRPRGVLAGGVIRRRISEEYTRHYLDTIDGDIVTGISGLDYYDQLSRHYPEHDVRILRPLLTALGLEAVLVSPWSAHSAFWRFWIANRQDGKEWLELFLRLRCIIRTLAFLASHSHTGSGSAASVVGQRVLEYSRWASAKVGVDNSDEPLVLKALDKSDALLRVLRTKGSFAETYHRIRSELEGGLGRVLIGTATEIERNAILRASEAITKRKAERRFGPRRSYFDLGLIGGSSTFLVQSEMGSGSPGASHATLADAIDDLKPKVVILAGIAFGIDEKTQAIGQILVSRQLQSYELARVGSKSGTINIRPRGDRATCSTTALGRFRSATVDWSGSPVEFGLMLSGEKLVDNLAYRDQLVELFGEVIGGEMEGAGLYAAARERNTDWIVVKAICDWADGNKAENKQQRQLLAAEQAALFVLRTIEQGGFAEPDLGTVQGTGKLL